MLSTPATNFTHTTLQGTTPKSFQNASLSWGIPLPDASVDCVISNCVLNLAPDKPEVFREIARVLKPGGRLAVSDIALKQDLPEAIAKNVAAYVGCIAGAIRIDDYRSGLLAAGFEHVEIVDSGADLNAYAKIENQSGCCSPAMEETDSSNTFHVVVSSCCSPALAAGSAMHDELKTLLTNYDVNAAAARTETPKATRRIVTVARTSGCTW